MPALKHLNSLDYIVIIIFLLMVAGVGIFVAKFNKGTKDYFKAGGKLPWLISSLSLFVSGFSAFMFVSASGFTYRTGLSAVFFFTASFFAYWLGFFIFGKLWRRSRIDSPMEILTRRYSQSTTYFYSIITVIPNILLMGTLIYTLCIFVSSALGFGAKEFDFGLFSLSGFEATLIGIGIILLVYTVLGGLWAVAVTDTLQFIILFLMTMIVFPLAFVHLGHGNFFTGFRNLWQQAPAGFMKLSSAQLPILFLVSFWIMNVFGYNVNWHIGQRYYSIADERDTKKMAALCAVLGLVGPVLWIMPVLVAKVLFPDLGSLWPELTEPTEASFVTLCLFILPNGFLGVLVSAILAASMSSADSTFNWLAAVITKDVYVPLVRKLNDGKEPSDRTQLLVGKGTVLIVGVLAILISLVFQKHGSSFDIYMNIYSMTTPVLFMPVMVGLVYRKTPWWSGMAAASAGIVTVIAMNIIVVMISGLSIHSVGDIFQNVSFSIFGLPYGKFELNIFFGIFSSGLVLFLSSRWPNKNQEDIDRLAALDADLRAPAYDKNGQIDKKSIQPYKIVAILSGILGGMLLILSFVSGSFRDISINFITGAGALLFGLFFWRMAKKYV